MIRILFLIFVASLTNSHAFTYKQITLGGVRYHSVTAAPNEIEIAWKSTQGKPLRTFAQLTASLPTPPAFIMNAGIFEPGGIPSGLHVENKKELLPLNLKDAPGNFFLKPNGVFLIESEKAEVIESSKYKKRKTTPRLAAQSGPLLLQNGSIHPKFRAHSKSTLHRNGVGILPDGNILFLITDQKDPKSRCNLHSFASAFIEKGCKDALFLDGDISKMTIPGKLEPQSDNHYGALFYIVASSD